MIKKFFAWLANNELAVQRLEILQLQQEVEKYKKISNPYLVAEVAKLENQVSELRKTLQKANSFSGLGDQLRSHALFLEKYEAQERHRTAGLQHVILWAIDAEMELKLLTQGKTEEYQDLRMRLKRIFDAYKIQGLEE